MMLLTIETRLRVTVVCLVEMKGRIDAIEENIADSDVVDDTLLRRQFH